ncbi:MAG: helix-turn-helix domain-containing protein [Planctomycetota bacterium]|jgi:excisionase family DNA binding protein
MIAEPTMLPASQAPSAARAAKELDELLDRLNGATLPLREVPTEIPAQALKLFARLLHELGKGNAVTLVPIHAELTTQQAADLLNVSRPHLVAEVLEAGKLPFRRVGNRRKVRMADLLAYQREREAERREIMSELVSLGQELEGDDLAAGE